jgi:hypothetical protein
LSGCIDICFTGATIDVFNLEMLNKELSFYDLELIEKKVLLDVLVLTRKADGPSENVVNTKAFTTSFLHV